MDFYAGPAMGATVPSGGARGPTPSGGARSGAGDIPPAEQVFPGPTPGDSAAAATTVAVHHPPTQTMCLLRCSGQGGEALLC